MGEYTVDLGLHIDASFCEVAADSKSIGVPIIRAINMDGDNCPPDPVCKQFDTQKCNTGENLYFDHFLFHVSLIIIPNKIRILVFILINYSTIYAHI